MTNFSSKGPRCFRSRSVVNAVSAIVVTSSAPYNSASFRLKLTRTGTSGLREILKGEEVAGRKASILYLCLRFALVFFSPMPNV